MCGLTAFLTLNADASDHSPTDESPEALRHQMDKSLEMVKHRGPDARGQWLSPDCRVGEYSEETSKIQGLIPGTKFCHLPRPWKHSSLHNRSQPSRQPAIPQC